MAQISSDKLKIASPLEIAAPDSSLDITIAAAAPLKTGVYSFQLEVVDDAGNRSQPTTVRIIIADDKAPVAVIDAPERVGFNTGFTLSGKRSTDIGGQLKSFIWTLVQGPA